MKRIKITQGHIYFAVYMCIALATFRHSMEGFASFEGNMWLGALSAIAVDALMILFAHSLRGGFKWALLFGMCFPAGLSVYTQLLFAISNAKIVEVAPGAAWLEQTAVDIINARVWLLPVSLPVSALLAALVGKNDSEKMVSADIHATTLVQLEAARQAAADLRKQAAESAVTHDETVARNQELAAFKLAVTDPDAWKTATSAARLVITQIFPNGNRPETKVLAELLKVSGAQIGNVARDVKAKQKVA